MSKVCLVDLDGTLCRLNSFRWWMLFSVCYLLLSLRWLSLAGFIRIILLRLTVRLDRVQMKQAILELTESFPALFISLFCRFLYAFTNRKVVTRMQHNEGAELVLCTAAPVCYVRRYAAKFAFSRVIASPSVAEPGWQETMGGRKLEQLEACYGRDVEVECVITDHHDDLPLILKAKKCLLVRPTSKTLEIIAGQVNFDIL